MRELVTKVRTLKKAGEKNPFVYVDLKKFLPTYCAQHVALTPKGEEKDKENDREKVVHACLRLLRCGVAFYVQDGKNKAGRRICLAAVRVCCICVNLCREAPVDSISVFGSWPGTAMPWRRRPRNTSCRSGQQ